MTIINEKDLLIYMVAEDCSDLYYWDYMKEVGFHVHRTIGNILVVMKKTKHQIRETDFETFFYHYCRYNTMRRVTPDEYFRFQLF